MDVLGIAQAHGDRVDVEHPVLARQEPGLDAGERRCAALLVDDDVGELVDEDLVAGPGVRPDRDLVAHRPGRHVDRRLLAEHPGHLGLELDHRRVVAPDVVAHRGLRHRPAHGRRGPRHRVGAKVDDPHRGQRIVPGWPWRCEPLVSVATPRSTRPARLASAVTSARSAPPAPRRWRASAPTAAASWSPGRAAQSVSSSPTRTPPRRSRRPTPAAGAPAAAARRTRPETRR